MNKSAKWKAFAESRQKSQKSFTKSQKKFMPKLNPNEPKKQRSFMVASMHMSRSRISSEGNEQFAKRGSSFSKDIFASRKIQSCNSESKAFDGKNKIKQLNLKKHSNESEVKKVGSNQQQKGAKAEVQKIKKKFNDFQTRVLKQLEKLQQYIEKYVAQINEKVGIANFPSFSAANINFKPIDFPPADKNQKIEKISPFRSPELSRKLVHSPQKIKKSQSFNKFFETIAKLKNDVKNLGQMSMIKEKVNEKQKLRQVKSDKNLKRPAIK